MDAASVLVFGHVARTGSMTAAAGELGWTQPAVSQHVKRLERALGTPLLLRSGRTSTLTEAGHVLARHAQDVAASLQAAGREVDDLVGLRAGRVRVQAFPSASATLIPAALARLASVAPSLEARSQEALPPQAEHAVRAGQTDLAVVFNYDDETPAYPDLQVHLLLSEPVYAVLPATHRLAARADLPMAELAGERWIAGCEVCRPYLIRAAAAAGFVPDVRHSTDDYLVAQGLVAAGLGATLLPGRALAAVRHPDIAAVPVQGQRYHVHAVLRPQAARVPAVRALLDALHTTAVTHGDTTRTSDDETQESASPRRPATESSSRALFSRDC